MIIAHDLGTTGNKASLHDNTGRQLGAVTVNYDAVYDATGKAEQNPQDWLNAVCDATAALLRNTGADPNSVTAMVISGQMMGAVFLDANLQPVRPAIIWADTRPKEQAARLTARIGATTGYQLLGHRIGETYTLEKIMYVRDTEPAVFARVAKVCVAKDYVSCCFTGRLTMDRSDASSTNAYDLTTRAWSAKLLDAADLPLELLPELVDSTEIIGTLRQEFATRMGLPTSVKVIAGGGDGPIAALGAGVTYPSDGAYLALGTSSWISFVSEQPVFDPQQRSFTFEHVVPGYFVPTATMQAAGASLEWFREIADPTGAVPVASLVAAAGALTPRQSDPIFLPYLLGERSPKWDPHARGAFVGLNREHGQAHLTAAVLEGVAHNLRQCLAAFNECGYDFPVIDAVGGAAASSVWLQLFANVFGIPVRQRSIAGGANSLGAAVTGLVALGELDFAAARNLTQVTAEFAPDPALVAHYQERGARFEDAWQALKPWFNS